MRKTYIIVFYLISERFVVNIVVSPLDQTSFSKRHSPVRRPFGRYGGCAMYNICDESLHGDAGISLRISRLKIHYDVILKAFKKVDLLYFILLLTPCATLDTTEELHQTV